MKAKQEFVPFSFSSSGTAQGSIVFAGYGATADEFHYDDYAGVDVKDKIVFVLRYEPPSFAVKAGKQGMTSHSQFITKAINARNHGAKALMLFNGKLGDDEEDLLTRFGSVSGPEDIGIIFAQVKNDVATEWLKECRQVARRRCRSRSTILVKPASFELTDSQSASLTVNIRDHPGHSG